MPLFLACYVEGVPTVLIVGTSVGVCRHFTPFFCRYFAASKQWQSEHWYIDNILFKGVCPSYSFLRHGPKKRTKRRAADCIFSAKNGSRLPKARKLASCACSNSPRFLTENAPYSLNAPKMRSEATSEAMLCGGFRPHIWSVKKIGSVFGREGRTAKSPKEMSCGPPKNGSDF